jgi:putative chitinase
MSLRLFQKLICANETGVLDKDTVEKTMEYWNLSVMQVSHFFGQCAHETGNFRTFTENLNYSAQGLANTWPTRFRENGQPNALAVQIQRNPERIANIVYANRMGNTSEGDGWKYRGRGAIQVTGKSNYQEFANFIKDASVMDNPDKVAGEYAFVSAYWFFHKHKLWVNDISDKSIEQVTRKINGGTHGLQDRHNKTHEVYRLIMKG